MMRIRVQHSILLILIIVAGCNSHGPDSLFGRVQHALQPVSACVSCHSSANDPSLDPLVTNGTGSAGKHVKHFHERSIMCERCHYNYLNAPTHMNGKFDTGNPAILNFNIVGPAGAWDPTAGTCSGVACHGSETMAWYGTNTWTTPSTCTSCHASAFSAALDPVATNGTPPAGRHDRHVSMRNIGCERCHYRYPAGTSHANGVLDTPDPAVSLVQFNIVEPPAGSWTGDTGPQTGRCASVSCHGTDTLSWYGTSTWTLPAACTTCHSSSYSSQLDPVVTNGSDNSGKHAKHVTDYQFACTKCHLNYPSQTSHASGIMDTQNPAVLLVYFDITNPTGTWINDTGNETGNCSSLSCHGTDSPFWYGAGGLNPLPPCASCHGNTVGVRRPVMGANGDFGANPAIASRHVTNTPGSDPSSDQCKVCHDMARHMGGTVRVRNADTGSVVSYDPANVSSLEPFCLSCHDSTGAGSTFITGGTPTSPFNDGSVLGTAPYSFANEINDSWARAYGHGPNGNHAVSDKITCLGTGQPGTGCHGNNGSVNAHGSVSRVLATGNFSYTVSDPFNTNDFALCFNCHSSYPGITKEELLGVKFQGLLDTGYGFISRSPDAACASPCYNPPYYIPGVVTLLADHNSAAPDPLNDAPGWGPTDMNLHWFHLGYPVEYRGAGMWGSLTCVNCHNVHGTSNPYGSTYEEMGYQHVSPDGLNRTGKMSDAAYTNDLLLPAHPTYCAFNCHYYQGPTKAWYYPIPE